MRLWVTWCRLSGHKCPDALPGKPQNLSFIKEIQDAVKSLIGFLVLRLRDKHFILREKFPPTINMTHIGACRIGQNKIFFGAEKVVALVHIYSMRFSMVASLGFVTLSFDSTGSSFCVATR